MKEKISVTNTGFHWVNQPDHDNGIVELPRDLCWIFGIRLSNCISEYISFSSFMIYLKDLLGSLREEFFHPTSVISDLYGWFRSKGLWDQNFLSWLGWSSRQYFLVYTRDLLSCTDHCGSSRTNCKNNKIQIDIYFFYSKFVVLQY